MTLLCCIVLFSCSDDDFVQSSEPESELPTNVEPRSSRAPYSGIRPVVLGPRISIPHTISVINTAQANLYPGRPPLSATHQYLRFRPVDQDDVVELLDWSFNNDIVMFDYPVHYEVVQEGDYYIDAAVTDSTLLYQYCTIPVSMGKPAVPSDVVEVLYLDDSNPFLLYEAYRLTGHEDQIERLVGDGISEDVVVEHYPTTSEMGCDRSEILPAPDCAPGCTAKLMLFPFGISVEGGPDSYCEWVCDCSSVVVAPRENDCGCPIPSNINRPAGCVQVEADFGQIDEVRLVRVQVWEGNWPWQQSDVTFTDRDGCWRVNRDYDDHKVKIRFENDNLKVRDTDYWFALRVVRGFTVNVNQLPHNNTHILYDRVIDRMEWAASHTANSDLEYRDRAAADGIPLPRTRINYTLNSGTGEAAAPMLQGNPTNSFLGIWATLSLPSLNFLSSHIQPDIVNQYGPVEGSRNFISVNMHELGHASHHAIVGEGYWVPYRNHIIANLGYGTFPNFSAGSSPGHVALGEAVGDYTQQRYGFFGGGDEGADFEENFIPSGLLFDLEDPNPDVVVDPNDATQIVTENVRGFTPAMMFDALAGATDIQTFRVNLRALHLSSTPTSVADYEATIGVYDVFN